jgi:hypothetical protein
MFGYFINGFENLLLLLLLLLLLGALGWLMRYATNRNAAGLIPDDVIGSFN